MHEMNPFFHVQMMDLAASLGPLASRLEVVIHQHLPIFHTEHCVFCRYVRSTIT
jgi:putative protease